MPEKQQPQQQPDGHQQMALSIHTIFTQGAGVPISSTASERVSEMKLWLAAIANGQLKIIDLAAPPVPVPVPIKEGNGTPPNED